MKVTDITEDRPDLTELGNFFWRATRSLMLGRRKKFSEDLMSWRKEGAISKKVKLKNISKGKPLEMSRMHCGRKGIAGSKKPLLSSVPTWVSYKANEVEALVVKLARQGLSASAIGHMLRDVYGIPDVQKITGRKLTKILKEKELAPQAPEGLQSLAVQAIRVKKHLEINRKDFHSKHGLQMIESKIRRLEKYYKREAK